MNTNVHAKSDNRKKIMISIYDSSLGISMTALAVVAVLEVFMLVYTIFNPGLYGPYLWRYRAFYFALLGMALVAIALNIYVKRDVTRRYKVLNIANPLCAVYFFAWSLLVTYSDLGVTGAVDQTVFMTFSLTVPLSFFLFPAIYAAIVVVADGIMVYLVLSAGGGVGAMINLGVFFIFQIVLGVTFLRLRTGVVERMVKEQENAEIDVLTGFLNRRVYEEDLKALRDAPVPRDLVYVTFDINSLKEINDNNGHDAGDRVIVGAAECIGKCFGEKGKLYRTGGDEYAAIITADKSELDGLLAAYDGAVRDWSAENGMELSLSHGYVCAADFDSDDVTAIAKAADAKMYAAKAQYYKDAGRDRRYMSAAAEE